MTICPHPLVAHRFKNQYGPPSTRPHECPDPDCPARPADHLRQVPCAWSWPLASGKASGEAFPRRRCPGCEHIRRAGRPDTQFAHTVVKRRHA